MSEALDRFIDAQRDTYAAAIAESCAGAKRSHWMLGRRLVEAAPFARCLDAFFAGRRDRATLDLV